MSPSNFPKWIILVLPVSSMFCGPLPLDSNTRSDGESLAPAATASHDGSATQPQGAPVSTQGPTIAGCPLFPPDNVWNTPVSDLPLDPRSDEYIETIGPDIGMHPDFGSGDYEGGPIGIPYTVVSGQQSGLEVSFEYEVESDPGPYPIPSGAPIEGGPESDGDRHVLVVDADDCRLYELFYAFPQAEGSWSAGSGAIFDLNSNGLRPDGWTSADAAGLPILPGLVRYQEVAAGEIRHALRFTAPQTQRAYIWPARHFASQLTEANYPPMGLRLRLKSCVDISGFSPEVRIILRALQTYGMLLADNGSPWFISGTPDERWDNDVLRELRQIEGTDFEVVDSSRLMIDADSAQARVGSAHPAQPSGQAGADG